MASAWQHLRNLLATWRGRFILVVLVAQLAIPLRYYVHHRDPHDERFAWRMFSPMRMTTCSLALEVDGQPQQLGKLFHDAWLTLAKRGRFEVIEAMGARLCGGSTSREVKLSADCTYMDRPARRWGGYNMCSVKLLAGS